MIRGHGGDVYGLARRLGCLPHEIIDMSSNINPLGVPPGLMPFLKNQLDRVDTLPEVDSRGAIDGMSRLLDVDPRSVLAGNGTTQFIYTACSALISQSVMVVGPTYADYADACGIYGITPHHFLADHRTGFDVQLDALDQAVGAVDTVFICNPNNPTGRLIPHDALVQLCRDHPKVRFIIDESYLPFVPRDQSRSMAGSVLENVCVLWSLSKIFGIPGLRAGFLIAGEALIAGFERYMQPWSLNSMAQAAVAWLADNPREVAAFTDKTQSYLQDERRKYDAAMAPLQDITLFPSLTSFMLLRLTEGLSAEQVCHRMGQHRFMLRNCSNFKGLSERYVRVALKDTHANLSALNQLINLLKR